MDVENADKNENSKFSPVISQLGNEKDEKALLASKSSLKYELKPVNSKFCVYICVMTQVTFFLQVGMSMTAINPITPALIRFFNASNMERHNESLSQDKITEIITLTQSMVYLGAFVSSLGVKILIKLASPNGCMIFHHVVNIVSLIICGPLVYVSKSYECMIAGRFINGFARGFAVAIVPIIVGETTCLRKLAVLQSPAGWLVVFGGIWGNVVGHRMVLGGDDLWPIALMISTVFSIWFLVSVPFIPDAPGYLMRHNQPEKALESLRKLRSSSEESIQDEFSKYAVSTNQNQKIPSFGKVFRNTAYRKQLIGVCIVMSNIQLVGLMGVSMYSDNVFVAAGIAAEYATYASIAMFVVTTISAVIGTGVIKRFGTRNMIVTGNVVICVALVVLTVSLATLESLGWMSIVAVTSVVIYMIGNGFGPSLVTFSIAAQITSPHTRPPIMTIGGSVFWLFSWGIAFTMPYMMGNIGPYTFLVFLGCTIVSTTYFVLKLEDLIVKPNIPTKKEELIMLESEI